MKSTLRLITIALIVSIASAADINAQACDCTELFQEVVVKLEANYIAVRHLDEQGEKAYADRKQQFSQKIKSTAGVECIGLLSEFVGFFEDRHLYVSHYPKGSEAVKEQIKGDLKKPEELLSLLKTQKAKASGSTPDEIIGNYTDGESDMVLILEDDRYNAYIVKTAREGVSAGELKATLSASEKGYVGTYYTYGYAARYTKASLYKQKTLLTIGNTIWLKTDAENQTLVTAVDLEKGINQPSIRKLDDKSVLITIPSFNIEYAILADLIKKEKDLLLQSENLIFDIRGNTGGNAIYFSLFTYFADQDMPGGQGQVLASADNLAYFERNLQYSKKIYKPVVQTIKEQMGEIIDGPLYPKRNYKRKKGSKVQNVAILTDDGCMSAAESFIIHAKANSSLVKTFGSPTRGVIDYTSVNSVKLTCDQDNIYFGYPTSTLHKRIPNDGFNKTGIMPDVPIGIEVADPIAYIIDYYKQGK